MYRRTHFFLPLFVLVALGVGAQDRQSRVARGQEGQQQQRNVVETFEQQRPVAQALIPEIHELPPSKVFQTDFVARGKRVELAGPDQEEIRQKVERAQARDQRLVVIGIPRDVSAKPESDGTWEQVSVQQDARVWAFSVASKEATSIRVHFNDVALPAGAKLYIYSPAFPEQAQVVEGKGPFDKGEFWSALIPGETVAIELLDTQARATSDAPLYFKIDQISHLFKDAIGPLNTAGSCNLDASCYSAWTVTGNSVARIIGTNGDTFACSGTLISDQANDNSPLFLTATHCFQSDSVANTAIVFWMFKTASCNGSAPSIYSTPQTIGASMVSQGQPDTTLLLLTGTVPANIPFTGWTNADPAHAASITAIHHPRGSWRRISFGTKQNDDYYYPDYHQVMWNSGITEPGSSGSPALNASHQITGTLSLGSSSCSNRNGTDYYSKLSLAYPLLNNEGVLVSGMPDTDSFGSHQTRQTAATLSLPFPSTTLAVKIGKDDWYKMTLAPGAKMVIHFQSVSAPEHLAFFSVYSGADSNAMYLYADPDSSTSYSIRNATTSPVDYYLQVNMRWGAYAHYTMSIDMLLPGPPTATLGRPSYLWGDMAQLLDSVDTTGVQTDYWYEYGTDSQLANFQTTTPNTIDQYQGQSGWGSTSQQTWANLSGLQPDTTYFYRVHARNSYGDGLSGIGTFRTQVAVHFAYFTNNPISFGSVTVGSSSTQYVAFINSGNTAVRMDTYTITGEGFKANIGALTQCVPANGNYCQFSITFKPTTPGYREGTFTINDGPNSYIMQLRGDAQLAPLVDIGAVNNNWWDQPVWLGLPVTRFVPITNSGSAPLVISNVVLPDGFKDMRFVMGDCAGSLPPGGSCTLTITFTPTITPQQAAYVYLYDNAPTSPQWVWISAYTHDLVLTPTRPTRGTRPSPRHDTETVIQKVERSEAGVLQEDDTQQASIMPGREARWISTSSILTIDESDSANDDSEPGTVLLDAHIGSEVKKVAIKTISQSESEK